MNYSMTWEDLEFRWRDLTLAQLEEEVAKAEAESGEEHEYGRVFIEFMRFIKNEPDFTVWQTNDTYYRGHYDSPVEFVKDQCYKFGCHYEEYYPLEEFVDWEGLAEHEMKDLWVKDGHYFSNF